MIDHKSDESREDSFELHPGKQVWLSAFYSVLYLAHRICSRARGICKVELCLTLTSVLKLKKEIRILHCLSPTYVLLHTTILCMCNTCGRSSDALCMNCNPRYVAMWLGVKVNVTTPYLMHALVSHNVKSQSRLYNASTADYLHPNVLTEVPRQLPDKFREILDWHSQLLSRVLYFYTSSETIGLAQKFSHNFLPTAIAWSPTRAIVKLAQKSSKEANAKWPHNDTRS